MFNKKRNCLLPVRVISVISKYINHHSSCFTCIICDNNQNESMNGNQQGITPSELMSLWLFTQVKSVVYVMICNILSTRFSNVKQSQTVQWLSSDNHFSRPYKKNDVRGRDMFVPKEKCYPKTHKLNHAKFKDHLYAHSNTINIGYARKSRTKEKKANRVKCLQRMVDKLTKECHASKVYVSPSSSVTSKLTDRDDDDSSNYLETIKNIKGDTNDMIQHLDTDQRDCRIITIEYSGFSNNLDDLKRFIKKYKQIKEIVVFTDNAFDIIDRYRIINNSEHVQNHFQPRSCY